jgi:hypothetical protein
MADFRAQPVSSGAKTPQVDGSILDRKITVLNNQFDEKLTHLDE